LKKVAIIGSVGVPANYGGFETLAENLAERLNENFEIHIYCSNHNYPKNERLREYNGAALHYLPFKANGPQSIAYDIVSIAHAAAYADTLLILGVPGAILIPIIRLFTRKKVLLNIDGLEWKRAKWRVSAKLFLRISEFIGVTFSTLVIADNQGIQNHINSTYEKASKLIPYGGDSNIEEVSDDNNLISSQDFFGKPYALAVCRIEPENNIDIILEAFKRNKSTNIVIIGNWENSQYGKLLKLKYSSCGNVYLMNPVYEKTFLNHIRANSSMYVHGHSAGGTNPSLVEAMCSSLPIIAFDVEYNRYTTENSALFFNDTSSLQYIIEKSSPESLNEI
jgi:glycosyltransferase involved in cell wall biosynthesis